MIIWPRPIEWFGFFMFLISVPLYIIFLVTIVKFRKNEPFNSPFFTLCLALGVGDLMALFNQWFLYKFEEFNWFGLGDFALEHILLAYIAVIASWQLALMQHFAVLGLAVNRFFALVTPDKYEMVWTAKVTASVIILEYAIPMIAVAPQAWLPFGYIINNATGSVGVPVWLDHEAQGMYYGYYIPFNILVNGATLTTYCIIFYKVHRQIHNHVNQEICNNASANRADVKLAVFGFCVSGVMLSYGVYAFRMAVQPPGDIEEYRFNVLLWQTISDTFSWCNAWLIIVCSKQVRDHMLALICFKPPPGHVTPHSTTKGRHSHRQVKVAESKM